MIETEQIDNLVGKTVDLLSFAQYCIHIHFEGDILLTMEGEFEYAHGQPSSVVLTTFPITHSSLMGILQSFVTSASINANGDLQLAFSNGDSLRLQKPLGYEGYRLRIGENEFFG